MSQGPDKPSRLTAESLLFYLLSTPVHHGSRLSRESHEEEEREEGDATRRWTRGKNSNRGCPRDPLQRSFPGDFQRKIRDEVGRGVGNFSNISGHLRDREEY